MSSHTDFLDLGFTGTEDYTHGHTADDDVENFSRFGTTTLGPLRNERMTISCGTVPSCTFWNATATSDTLPITRNPIAALMSGELATGS